LTSYKSISYNIQCHRGAHQHHRKKKEGEMTELDRAFEMILEWKARRMLYADYQASIGAATYDRSFKVGAIDAMVYDLASLVGFNRKTADHANWASYGVRKTFLDKLRNGITPPQAPGAAGQVPTPPDPAPAAVEPLTDPIPARE
jgi:hypothetical protein